jgi:hypothetical protein
MMGARKIAINHEGKVMASMCTTRPHIYDLDVTVWKVIENLI